MSGITTTYSTNTKPTTSTAGGTTSDSIVTKKSSPTGSSTSSNSPACAVCKYRRRRCASDCILAPYFPAEHQREFLNVHKLFGVSNMIRVVESIDEPAEKEIAMKTMIYQANVRANDPARGCCRIIDNLQRQLYYYQAQLDNVCSYLDAYRSRELHGNYLDENQLVMAESWRESDNNLPMHFVDGVEVLNGGAGKKPLSEHHIRGKLVGEYMDNEPSFGTDHIKNENNYPRNSF